MKKLVKWFVKKYVTNEAVKNAVPIAGDLLSALHGLDSHAKRHAVTRTPCGLELRLRTPRLVAVRIDNEIPFGFRVLFRHRFVGLSHCLHEIAVRHLLGLDCVHSDVFHFSVFLACFCLFFIRRGRTSAVHRHPPVTRR